MTNHTNLPPSEYTLRGEAEHALLRVALLQNMVCLERDLHGGANAPTVIWLRRKLYIARRDWIRLLKAARQKGEL